MISISQLRDALKLAPELDHEIEARRDVVVALWESATQRLWNRRVDHVEIIRPRHDRLDTLLLELWPIESVTKVETRRLWETDWTELTSGWKLTGERELTRVSAYWECEVRVTYTGGYTENPGIGQTKTPAEIAAVLLVHAQFMQVRLAPERIAIKSQNFEGGSGVYEDADLHPLFKRLASARRRLV